MLMRANVLLLLGLAVFAADGGPAAAAQNAAVHVATYIEVVPQSAQAAAAALKNEAAESRKDEGCRDAQALREIGQDNRFIMVEAWKDRDAFDAHARSSHVVQSRNWLAAIELAPPDERILAGVWERQGMRTAAAANAVWVVTHVDAMPQYLDESSSMLERLGEESVKEAGNLRFLVAHQPDRPNHFTVIESWADRTSFEAHQAAGATKRFREKLNPMLGALYDQRVYRAVD
jgi:quinol monooxygenase YgiN